MAEAIRWRSIGGALVSYFEPATRPSDDLVGRWHAALIDPAIAICLAASLGPIQPSPDHRRATTRILLERSLRVVIVSDDRIDRAMAKLLAWMGVPTRACGWAQLDELASELIGDEQADELSNALVELREQGSIRLA
ncbi:hypothetical protein ACNOYE_28730 [Nannocystaceae bacterium ST9]